MSKRKPRHAPRFFLFSFFHPSIQTVHPSTQNMGSSIDPIFFLKKGTSSLLGQQNNLKITVGTLLLIISPKYGESFLEQCSVADLRKDK